MSTRRYNSEFKDLAVAQVVDHGYPVKLVAERFAVSSQSLYSWLARRSQRRRRPRAPRLADLRQENQQLKDRLRRIEDERDSLKRVVERLVRANR